MSNPSKWLICVQTTYNCIKYQTSDGDIKYPRYQDFLTLMMDFNVKDPSNFKNYLDSFIPLYVDLNTGDWEEVGLERRDDVSFEELVVLNPNESKSKDNAIDKLKAKGKKFIKNRKKLGY